MYLFLAFTSLILISVSFNLARRSKSQRATTILYVFTGIFFVSFFLFGTLSQKPRPVPEEFTDIVPAYANSRISVTSPTIINENLTEWAFKTKDKPEMIFEFYKSLAENNNWTFEVEAAPTAFAIKKDGLIIYLLITRRFGTYTLNFLITEKEEG